MNLSPKMSNKCQNSSRMTFVKLKHCDVMLVVLVFVVVNLAAILPARTTTFVDCAKLETQIKLLINDDDLLLEQEQREPKHVAAAAAAAAVSRRMEEEIDNGGGGGSDGSIGAEDHERFNLYRSELKRLSYETIHRILRDENEPIYRREDTELHYYQKRSPQPTAHEVVRRSTRKEEEEANEAAKIAHSLHLSERNLRDFNVTRVLKNADLSAVNEIDLSSNKLQQINLTEFSHLQILNLSHNALNAFPLLSENSSLLTLNLNGNHIRHGRAPNNAHLRELHLSANLIENLSTLNLSQLSALETLDLSCNHIQNLETAFFPQRMHNLKHLNLAHNNLHTIFRETFYNLLSLNTLLLTHNNITDIDYETFLALPNLQFLDLSYNQLKGESIRALQGIPDLVRLSIAYNSEVGASMQEFVASWSLKELDASGTGLCQIPAALAQSVRTLKLTDNWLKIINCGDLDSYPLLQYLDLSHSHIADIEDDALGRLEILEVLFLDHNNLHKVPISLPTSLEHLFLQHNQIMDVQVQSFQGLNNLQTLDLSGNKLLYLPALQLPKLLTLNLQSSELKGLSQAIVHTLPRLRDLMLEENPIKCSDLLGIAEWASPCRIGSELPHGDGGGASTTMNGVASSSDGGMSGIIMQDEVGEQQLNVGQQQQQQQEQQQLMMAAAIDLKQKFLQMHNFFEKFKSNCVVERQMESRNALKPSSRTAAPPTPPTPPTPPSCAIEALNDAKEAEQEPAMAMEAPKMQTESISFNLPSELQKEKQKKNTIANKEEVAEVFKFNQKNFTAEIAKTLQLATKSENDKAPAATAISTAAATTPIMPRNNTPTKRSMSAKIYATTKTLKQSTATATVTATTALREQQIMEQKTQTTTRGATANATATTENIEYSNNHSELKMKQVVRQSFVEYVDVSTATSAVTAAAVINSNEQQKQPQSSNITTTFITKTTHMPSTSSLNNSSSSSKSRKISTKPENVDTKTTTRTATAAAAETTTKTAANSTKTLTLTSISTSTPAVATAAATISQAKNYETTAIHMPQTISATIKSGNNYVETTSLLRQKEGFKTISAATAAPPTPTTTATRTMHMSTTDKDLTQNDSSNDNDNNKVTENKQRQQQKVNNFKHTANSNFNDISGQQQNISTGITTEPTATATTTEDTVLARAQHQRESLPSHDTTAAAAAITITTKTSLPLHKHEPLQLHIKDRHLIGTPLLMHKGENILVEAEQLKLPATAPSAPMPLTSTYTSTPAAAAEVAAAVMTTTTTASATYGDSIDDDDTTEKGNSQDMAMLLAKSQSQSQQPHSHSPVPELMVETKWLRDITGLTESDKHNAKTEAINEKINEHNRIDDEDEKQAAKIKFLAEAETTTPFAFTLKNPKKHEDKKKPSLIMKKMTITKHSNPQQHYTLNTPRENEAAILRSDSEGHHFKELKPVAASAVSASATAAANEEDIAVKVSSTAPHHKHSTVNTPIISTKHQYYKHELQQQHQVGESAQYIKAEKSIATSAAAATNQEHAVDRISKTEQLLDIRKATTTGHPGAVILLSFSLFVILLIGLMHVYRCDMPWRRHLSHHQQRPHQRRQQLNEDDAHSFLNYHSNQQQQQQQQQQTNSSAAIQKWHHSTRLQPPYSSPLHNLHVRELQKTSAAASSSHLDMNTKSNRRDNKFYTSSAAYFDGGGSNTNNNNNNSSSSEGGSGGSHSSSSLSSAHSSSAILDNDDAFYIEMTPYSGQPAGTLHSDMLPMELLSVSSSITSSSRRQMNAINELIDNRVDETHTATGPAVECGLLRQYSNEISYDHDDDVAVNARKLNVKLTPSTRKFDLW